MPTRLPCLHHCTSLPFRFFGRDAELALLEQALREQSTSLVAFVGPGGQGKTAIVQHWQEALSAEPVPVDGLFLWSFYRGKDADLCLRELYAYAAGFSQAPELSGSYCVDHLLPILRRERWAVILDGAEVVQYENGPWFGRFIHPELGRLLSEIASAPMPGVVALTTRFPLPELELRRHMRQVNLGGLDRTSARELLLSLGVCGSVEELDEAAAACGSHAKAVELLGTYLVRFAHADVSRQRDLPNAPVMAGASAEEQKVARLLAAYQAALTPEAQDVLALATAFREPAAEARLLEYLTSRPVHTLLHTTWQRSYPPFTERPATWLAGQVQELVELRLLERVRAGARQEHAVIDAHPLVRRAFSHVRGPAGQAQSAQARAGFLRGRPDRTRPQTLEEAREEIELFHAHCEAGLWNESDSTFVALENPKQRLLAPGLERELLLCFFPDGDWRRPPLWPGFGRYRSLAICFEMLGQYEDALAAYRAADAPLCGDALLALGRLQPLLDNPLAAQPWNTLWQAYRCHALCLSGRVEEAVTLARTLVPVDIYEWIHVFECLLRAGLLQLLDLRSVLFNAPHSAENRWSELARVRMRADYLRLQVPAIHDLRETYAGLLEAYDRSGLPYERALSRLGYARWLLSRNELIEGQAVAEDVRELSRRFAMPIIAADALALQAELAEQRGQGIAAAGARMERARICEQVRHFGPARP